MTVVKGNRASRCLYGLHGVFPEDTDAVPTHGATRGELWIHRPQHRMAGADIHRRHPVSP